MSGCLVGEARLHDADLASANRWNAPVGSRERDDERLRRRDRSPGLDLRGSRSRAEHPGEPAAVERECLKLGRGDGHRRAVVLFGRLVAGGLPEILARQVSGRTGAGRSRRRDKRRADRDREQCRCRAPAPTSSNRPAWWRHDTPVVLDEPRRMAIVLGAEGGVKLAALAVSGCRCRWQS